MNFITGKLYLNNLILKIFPWVKIFQFWKFYTGWLPWDFQKRETAMGYLVPRWFQGPESFPLGSFFWEPCSSLLHTTAYMHKWAHMNEWMNECVYPSFHVFMFLKILVMFYVLVKLVYSECGKFINKIEFQDVQRH